MLRTLCNQGMPRAVIPNINTCADKLDHCTQQQLRTGDAHSMTFQAYLDNIEAKTGVSAAQFIELARENGFLEAGTKATPIITWLADEYGLGRGHAMALVSVFKRERGE